MYLTTPSKTLLLLAISLITMIGCKPAESGNTAPAPPAETAKTESPFSNKDPEKYQAEIWQTSASGTDKYFIARDGTKWRFDSAYGDPSQITTIRTDKEIVISAANNVYAEYPLAHGFDERENTVSEMTFKMLNSKGQGTFEKIGSEGGVTKYKVLSDDDKGKESVVSFDEKLGLPVKKEIYKGTGADRTLEMTVTLNGFKTDVDASMFEVPKDVKKVSIDEMKKALSGTK